MFIDQTSEGNNKKQGYV